MARKPSHLIYAVDENPGWGALFVLGLQHLFLLSIAFIFPVVVVDAIGGTPDQAQSMISMAMLTTGVGTILQGLKRGPIGSGYLCPLLNGPAFLSASLLAGRLGGLSMIFGMTAVGGIFEALFARIVYRMRAVFPAEVTGTIVTMVGIEIIPVAAHRFMGVDRAHHVPHPTAILVALVTLLAMVCFNVWGKGKLRLYSVLLGLGIGYAIAFGLGILRAEDLQHLREAPLVTVPPFGRYGMSVSASLLVPFLVATLSSALKTMGDLSICQKTNDADWKRPEMRSIGRGILACGIGNILSGTAGAMGQSVSSSNVGLSIATGATSRRIAYAIGCLLILLAFCPKLAAIFVIMPTPIMGASLIFSASFMILAGIQILMSRMIDSRKTFVVGISLVFGLSVEFAPHLYQDAHPWLQPVFASSLSLATVCAILLNLLFRIGIAKSAALTLVPGVDSSLTIATFMERQGALWGASKDIIDHAALVMNEFMESVAALQLVKGDIKANVSFDEFNLDVSIAYTGRPVAFSDQRPSGQALLEDASGVTKLSIYLMKAYADRVKTWEEKDECRVLFHFDH